MLVVSRSHGQIIVFGRDEGRLKVIQVSRGWATLHYWETDPNGVDKRFVIQQGGREILNDRGWEIMFTDLRKGKMHIAVAVPKHVSVWRLELYEKKKNDRSCMKRKTE